MSSPTLARCTAQLTALSNAALSVRVITISVMEPSAIFAYVMTEPRSYPCLELAFPDIVQRILRNLMPGDGQIAPFRRGAERLT